MEVMNKRKVGLEEISKHQKGIKVEDLGEEEEGEVEEEEKGVYTLIGHLREV